MAGIWSFRLNLVKNLCLNYSRNLVLFNFRGNNARVFQRVSMNLNMTAGQAAWQLLCRYTQSTLAESRACWIAPIVTCGSIKRTCGCTCLKCAWSVALLTGGRGANRPPWQVKNVKTGPYLACILVFTILLVSVDSCSFVFIGVFSGDFRFFYSRSTSDLLLFLNYFLSVSKRLSSAKFLPGSNLQLRHCTWSKQGRTADKSYVQGEQQYPTIKA